MLTKAEKRKLQEVRKDPKGETSLWSSARPGGWVTRPPLPQKRDGRLSLCCRSVCRRIFHIRERRSSVQVDDADAQIQGETRGGVQDDVWEGGSLSQDAQISQKPKFSAMTCGCGLNQIHLLATVSNSSCSSILLLFIFYMT